PKCSAPGCGKAALYKVAATWSDGTHSELKNYGLACEAHRAEQLARARSSRQGLTVSEGEKVGEVGLYQLMPGLHDRELTPVPDPGMSPRAVPPRGPAPPARRDGSQDAAPPPGPARGPAPRPGPANRGGPVRRLRPARRLAGPVLGRPRRAGAARA